MPAITVDPSKAPLPNVKYTAPLVEADATPADRQIYSELAQYRRTIDAIKQRRDDRLQEDVLGLLASARNELYKRDAIRAQMDEQKVAVEGQLRTFALLEQEQAKQNRAAAKFVDTADANLRKHSATTKDGDGADPSLVNSLSEQVAIVQRHRLDGRVPQVASLEKIEKEVAEEPTRKSSF
jgi:hypothetical protein